MSDATHYDWTDEEGRPVRFGRMNPTSSIAVGQDSIYGRVTGITRRHERVIALYGRRRDTTIEVRITLRHGHEQRICARWKITEQQVAELLDTPFGSVLACHQDPVTDLHWLCRFVSALYTEAM